MKRLKIIFSLLLIMLVRTDGFSSLADSGISMTGIKFSAIAWADFDRDGDYDLAICGQTSDNNPYTAIYVNTAGNLLYNSALSSVLDDIYDGSLSWGDYDSDGYLDLVVSGSPDGGTNVITKLYRYTGSAFVFTAELPYPVYRSSIEWGDYDNDGDVDLAVMGLTKGGNYSTKIYRNINGSFEDSGISITGAANGNLRWADYNNDGYLDLSIMGKISGSPYQISRIYNNNGDGTFTLEDSTFTAVFNGCMAWGDYDNDGDLDMALTGNKDDTGIPVTEIYKNSGSPNYNLNRTSFTPTAVFNSYCAWGDYDNDGDLDLALLGQDGGDPLNRYLEIWEGPSFSVSDTTLNPKVEYGVLCWADYDNDRDLDLAVCGSSGTNVYAKIYENDEADTGNPNIMPYFPTAVSTLFSYEFKDQKLTLSWPAASDDKDDTPTLPNGLYYHLWLGEKQSIGEEDVVSAMYGTPLMGGFLSKKTKDGKNARTININAGTFYWKVQVIDAALGYSWYDVTNTSNSVTTWLVAIDTSAPLGYPGTPDDGGKYTYVNDITFTWDVGTANDPDSGIQGYFLEIGTTLGGKDVYSGDVGNQTSFTITGSHGNTYYAKVKARNGRTDLDFDVEESTEIYTYQGPYLGWSNSSDGITVLKMVEVDNNVFKPLRGDSLPNIIYQLKEPTHVTLRIYNLLGEEVRELVNEDKTRLDNNVEWDGKNNDGKLVSSGVYVVFIKTGYGESIEKIVLIK